MTMQLILAWRYLRGRRLRTVLTTLAIVFGVAMLFGLRSLLPSMLQAFRQNMLAAAGKVDLTVTLAASGTFGTERLETVRGVPGIAAATGSLHQTVLLPATLTGEAAADPVAAKLPTVNAVIVVGLDPATAQTVRTYPLQEGRFLEPGDDAAVVLPSSLAAKLNLAVGDTFRLPSTTGTADLKVVGLVASRPLPGSEEIYLPLTTAQTLLRHPHEINTIEAIFQPGVERAQVEAAVLAALGDAFKLGALEFGNELFAALQLGEYTFAIFGLIGLAMGAFIIFNTFRTVVAERRRDLGMLRAIGASRATVVGLLVTESLLQAAVGTVVGLVAGYAFAFLLTLMVNPLLQQFMHISMGAPIITWDNLLGSVAMGVGITFLGGLLPALSAARVTPLEALRPITAATYERTARRRGLVGAGLIVLAAVGLLAGRFWLAGLGTLFFLAGLVLIAPALVQPIARTFGRWLELIFAREGQIAQGNLTRQPGRAAVTASAMMIGLATVLALASIMTSVSAGFIRYLDVSLGSDFIVMPSSMVLGGGNLGAGPELAQQIRATPGIRGVTTLRLGLTTVNGNQLQVIGIDPATYPDIAGLEFSAGESAAAFATLGRERALIVNGIFATQTGTRVGDWLSLKTPEGDQLYRVVAIGMDYLNAKLATAYISQANLERDFHQTTDLLLLAELADGAEVAPVRRALETLVARYPAFTLLDWQVFRQQQIATFNSAMAMLYVMMIMFALPALIAMINTLAINVIERTREIGMLRAVGSTRRQVQRMILAESLLLASAGIVFGILAGLWLGYVLVQAMNVSGFVMEYYFPLGGLLAAIATGLLFGLLAATIPARQAARLDIVTALRYE